MYEHEQKYQRSYDEKQVPVDMIRALTCMVEKDADEEVDLALDGSIICWSCQAMSDWI